jgi:hypothetical protein
VGEELFKKSSSPTPLLQKLLYCKWIGLGVVFTVHTKQKFSAHACAPESIVSGIQMCALNFIFVFPIGIAPFTHLSQFESF